MASSNRLAEQRLCQSRPQQRLVSSRDKRAVAETARIVAPGMVHRGAHTHITHDRAPSTAQEAQEAPAKSTRRHHLYM
ncbi:hypothetical protein PR002_g6724 [Phytophthora rubi]|uniref:Uncharacterized protein n=1 Tax=Phytophthora rubi TaxID=129364 RepID=A0A6A3N7A6_9STRA|nr:hypothetical protein PR002_g6724 [Phytophthora rubi]